MKRLQRITEKYYPVIIFFLFFIIIFRKVFVNSLFPYPGDLLVSFFFPYSSGGWEGYSSWITHKEYVAADVVRQLYPWRSLVIDLFTSGSLPLWNPYAFSGTPLAANLQSAAFYPLNIIFFFLPKFYSWMGYVLLQPIIMGCGVYLFIRSLSLKRPSALFAACVSGFVGYLAIWFELGVVGHTASWLPFVLWGITEFSKKKKRVSVLLASLFLGLSFLSGHAQTAVYVVILSVSYFIITVDIRKKIHLINFFLFICLGFGLAAIQIIPSGELLFYSARNAPESVEIFHRNLLPFSHLVTLFAPDFFGNQTTNNYWGQNYGEFMLYVGIVALLFAVIGVFTYARLKTVRFFLTTVVVSLLFALPGPLSESLVFFHIPVLGTGIPARTIFLFGFSMVILSAYGVEALFSEKKAKIVLPIAVVSVFYLLIWASTLLIPTLVTGADVLQHFAVAKRNLILPSGIFFISVVTILISRRYRKVALGGLIILLFLAAVEYQYFWNKFLPFAPANYFYPEHPVITKLQHISGTDRVYGYDTARIETNLATAWRVYSPEGYDPLYIRNYGVLLAGTKTDAFPKNIARSDAVFADTVPTRDSEKKQRVLNVLGVKYLTDKNDTPSSSWEPNVGKFPEDRFKLLWQEGKWKVYENIQALPRTAVFYSWQSRQKDEEVLRTFFARDFTYRDSLVIGGSPPEKQSGREATNAEIVSYSPNSVEIRANALEAGMLFLSDTYYPGWKAYVDGTETKIYPADYALRAVPLGKGNHTIRMVYQPVSFILGAAISFVSFSIFGLLLHRFSRKKHHS